MVPPAQRRVGDIGARYEQRPKPNPPQAAELGDEARDLRNIVLFDAIIPRSLSDSAIWWSAFCALVLIFSPPKGMQLSPIDLGERPLSLVVVTAAFAMVWWHLAPPLVSKTSEPWIGYVAAGLLTPVVILFAFALVLARLWSLAWGLVQTLDWLS